jgi:mevalonate kinase
MEKLRMDPLQSYLSIPILINSKDNVKLLAFQIKFWMEKNMFLLDSGIVGETAPMVSTLSWKT